MSNLGELLKAEREKRGLSLHEIGMSLKINPKILKAIEEGDQTNLPAKTFLRGFVKSYAQYLRLDAAAFLQMFQEEYGNTRPEEPAKAQPAPASPVNPTHAPKYENSLKRPDDSALPVANNNRIYTILVAILLLTLIAFVAKIMDKYQKESEISKTVVEDTSTSMTLPLEETETETVATLISGEGTSGDLSLSTPISGSISSESADNAQAVVSTVSTTSTTLKPAPTTTSTTSTSTSTTLRAVSPTSTTTTTSPSTTTTTLAKAASIEVIIEALNKVTIRFTLTNGQNWETIELNPDQVHTFRSRSGVLLEISDGGAVNVIVNGRDRGVPGTIGKPLKLKYP